MKNKDCFSDLNTVFPMGNKGLREVPPECFQCHERVDCLRAALRSEDGLQLREQNLDRTSEGGMMGRLKRWSQKKELHRLRKAQEKKVP